MSSVILGMLIFLAGWSIGLIPLAILHRLLPGSDTETDAVPARDAPVQQPALPAVPAE